MSIALGLYSVYKELQTDIGRTLFQVKQLGYEGVEFYGEFTESPERIRDLLKQYELINCGWHTEWKLLQPDTLAATLDYHLCAGTPRVIIPALGGPWEIGHTLQQDSAEVWVKHAHAMNDLSYQLKAYDLQLGYHTHAHEFNTHYGAVTPWEIICEHTNPDIILELDTGNCIEGGANPAEVLSRIHGRPVLVHCKPFSHQTGLETHIGETHDDNDWPETIRQCRLAGTQWLIVEHESNHAYPQFDGAKRCLDGIRRFMTH